LPIHATPCILRAVRELEGRTAVLTGAAGGIGEHIARALAREKMALVLSGRNEAALNELRDELRSAGTRAESVVADLGRRDELHSLIPRAEAALGPVDVLVNNAGVQVAGRFVDITDDQVDEIVSINLVAPMLLTRDALPGMLDRGRGHVVTIASLAGKLSLSCNEHYGMTKAGLIRLTQGLRAEFRNSPVGFSVVSPGFTSAGIFTRMGGDPSRVPRTTGVGPPEKVAEAVVKAIKHDLPDVNVNPVPVGPALAMEAVAPRLFERLVVRGAPNEMLEEAADQS